MSEATNADELARSSALGAVDELTALCVSTLDDALVAVVLHGSLVSGDFVASVSDIDLLVVVNRRLSKAQMDALSEKVPSGAQRRQVWIDFRVVTAVAARVPQREPSMELYVGRHRDVPGHLEIERGPRAEADLLFEFSICREHGRSQTGPPPRELIGPVPLAWMVEVGDGYLKRWQETEYEEHHADLMIFTACRLWRLHDEGTHCSKADAAAWALARNPALVVPRVALDHRASLSNEPLPQATVMAFLETVRRLLTKPPADA